MDSFVSVGLLATEYTKNLNFSQNLIRNEIELQRALSCFIVDGSFLKFEFFAYYSAKQHDNRDRIGSNKEPFRGKKGRSHNTPVALVNFYAISENFGFSVKTNYLKIIINFNITICSFHNFF